MTITVGWVESSIYTGGQQDSYPVGGDRFIQRGGPWGGLLIDYDPGLQAFNSTVDSGFPWPGGYEDNIRGTMLSDGRVLYLGGYDGIAALTDVRFATYAASAVTWVNGTPLPEGVYEANVVQLMDGRVCVFGGLKDPNTNDHITTTYFGTISGNSITWDSDPNGNTLDTYVAQSGRGQMLTDGRLLVQVQDPYASPESVAFYIGTVTGNYLNWVSASAPLYPCANTTFFASMTPVYGNKMLFSGGSDPGTGTPVVDLLMGYVVGNTLTFQDVSPLLTPPSYAIVSMGWASDGQLLAIGGGFGWGGVSTEIAESNFAITGGSLCEFGKTQSTKLTVQTGTVASFAPIRIWASDFAQAPGSATSFVSNVAARQLAITEGSATNFISCTKEGAFTISEGSTTSLRIKDAVERFNFAMYGWSQDDFRGSYISGTRFSARAGSIFRGMPAFEWPSAIVSRCASRTAFRSSFQAPGDFSEAAGSTTAFAAASRASAAFSSASGSAAAFASRPTASTYFGAACQSTTAFHSRQFAGAVGAVPGASACAFVGSSSFTALPPAPNFDNMLFVTTTTDAEFLLERQ